MSLWTPDSHHYCPSYLPPETFPGTTQVSVCEGAHIRKKQLQRISLSAWPASSISQMSTRSSRGHYILADPGTGLCRSCGLFPTFASPLLCM